MEASPSALLDFFELCARNEHSKAMKELISFLQDQQKILPSPEQSKLLSLLKQDNRATDLIGTFHSPQWRAEIYKTYALYYQNRLVGTVLLRICWKLKTHCSNAKTGRHYLLKCLESLRQCSGREADQCTLLNALANMYLTEGTVDEAEMYVQEAAQLATETKNEKEAILAQILKAQCMTLRGRFEESKDTLECLLQLKEVQADPILKMTAQGALSRVPIPSMRPPQPAQFPKGSFVEDTLATMHRKLIDVMELLRGGNLAEALNTAEEGIALAKQLNVGPMPEAPFHLVIGQIKGQMARQQDNPQLAAEATESLQKGSALAKGSELLSTQALSSRTILHTPDDSADQQLAEFAELRQRAKSHNDLDQEVYFMLQMVRILYKLSRFDEARALLLSAESLTDEAWQRMKKDQHRLYRLDKGSEANQLLQYIYVKQGLPFEALMVSENIKARALVEALKQTAPTSAPIAMPSFQNFVKECHATFVEYSILTDLDTKQPMVVIWVINTDHIQMETTTLPQGMASIRDRIADLRAALLRNMEKETDTTFDAETPSAQELLRRFYDALIKPIHKHLPETGSELVIVPQGDLFLLPWAALLNEEEVPLIKFYNIRLAPSIACLGTLNHLAQVRKVRFT